MRAHTLYRTFVTFAVEYVSSKCVVVSTQLYHTSQRTNILFFCITDNTTKRNSRFVSMFTELTRYTYRSQRVLCLVPRRIQRRLPTNKPTTNNPNMRQQTSLALFCTVAETFARHGEGNRRAAERPHQIEVAVVGRERTARDL
jgi:hypothetical protein